MLYTWVILHMGKKYCRSLELFESCLNKSQWKIFYHAKLIFDTFVTSLIVETFLLDLLIRKQQTEFSFKFVTLS